MIGWGIIGCGNVTEMKSGPAFSKVPDSRLVAVMRRDAIKAEDYARRHRVPKFYTDADDLINDREIDAVYIATPPSFHAEYAIKVLQAGKPVYIEKPMSVNYGECIRINEEAAKRNLPVFVAYYRRTLPGFLKIKELIEKGEIGNVRFANIQIYNYLSPDEKAGKLPWRVVPGIAGAGHFFDLASHQLDYFDYLFGPVQKIASTVVNQAHLYEAEDLVSASFVFNNDIILTGTWCFTVSPEGNRDSLEIFGDRGMIKTSTFSFEPIILINDRGQTEFENVRPEHVQYFLIEQIVNELTGKGKAVSTGLTAARTNKIMDEVVKEYYGRRKQR